MAAQPHRLLAKQLARARKPTGEIDVDSLLALVSEAYAEADRDRRRTDRSIELMVEELETRHREVVARERDLTAQNGQFRDALDNMGHGLSMYDGEGRLVVCNQLFLRLFGLEEAGIGPGTPFETILRLQADRHAYKDPPEIAELARPYANFGHREREMRDGRIVAITRVQRSSGGWVSVFEDVTERRRLEREREQAAKEAAGLREQERAAEAVSKAKSEFLATMSHEIRTPMNAVLGLATTLLETALNSAQRQSVEAIHGAGNALLHLLNDILDLSKLDAGRMDFEAIPFAPADLLAGAVSIGSVAAAGKQLSMRTEIGADLPAALKGDPGRIRQIVLNLATNAVKFTEAGEVIVGARLVEDFADRATIEWWVRDTGIGIAPEQVARLFSEYSQADTSISRRFGGTGLGLAICRRIVRQMGGEIAVQSELGVGSLFTFRLTLPKADPGLLGAGDTSDSSEDLKQILAGLGRKLRILIAEDNPINQLVAAKMLEGFAVSVHLAANGFEAVAGVRQFNPDIVFMDMRMPEKDGLAATREIRALGGSFAVLPIVALTANAFADDMRACREAGMTDFLAKPVSKNLLIGRVAGVARAIDRTGTPPASDGRLAPTPQPGDDALLDRTVLGTLVEDIGERAARRTHEIYLADTAKRLQTMRTLRCETDRTAIKNEAHALKGSSATVGFLRMRNLAADLERRAPAIGPDEYKAALDRFDAVMVKMQAERFETVLQKAAG